MKNIKKFIWTVIFVSGICFTINAQNVSDFQTIIENGTIIITGYTGTVKNLNIPEKINGIPVTVIGDKAFESKGLTSVTIAKGIQTIGVNAFAFNPLNNIKIPDSVISIGSRAFYYQVIENFINVGMLQSLSNTEIDLEIGSNVNIAVDSFNVDFYALYHKMNKAKGKYLFLGFMWLVPGTGQTANDFHIGFSWDGDGAITIFGYMGDKKDLIIPSVVAGVPVKHIKTKMFNELGIRSIVIPAGIETIEEGMPSISTRDTSFKKFTEFYNQTGKRAGKYTLSSNNWSFSAN